MFRGESDIQRVGDGSWRFGEDVPQIPHGLLFVRDALRLDVAATAGVPPRLAGDVSDRSELLDVSLRGEAAALWPAWWADVVAMEVSRNVGTPPGGDHREWMQGLGRRLARLIDPPKWHSLADRPALQAAAKAAFAEGCRWADARLPALRPPARGPLFGWERTRDAAKLVADELGVDVGVLNGCAIVLLVEGIWSEPAPPGAVLCSLQAAEDPETAAAVVRQAFTSGASR